MSIDRNGAPAVPLHVAGTSCAGFVGIGAGADDRGGVTSGEDALDGSVGVGTSPTLTRSNPG